MQVSQTQTDGTPQQTGKLMRMMVEKYYLDMTPYASYTLKEIYDTIKNLPFRYDPPDLETLQRPLYTMTMQGFGGDCDDKCIALASYCKLAGIPFQFIAVRRPDHQYLHHVLCQVYIKNNHGAGQWIHADPTYRFNALGREREKYAEYVTI